MSFMTIGEFGARTRLSAKALRLYDQLGLVVPAEVDAKSGYRRYADTQVDAARLVALLRRLDMPLAAIADIVALDPPDAAKALDAYWQRVEGDLAERRALVSYLRAHLEGAQPNMYDIQTRPMPERQLLTISRHVRPRETDAFFGDAFSRLRQGGAGLSGIEGVPFLIFYGEVSDDSDGPIELCRPIGAAPDAVSEGLQVRVERAHDEAYIRLTQHEVGWPTMLPALNALERWVDEQQRKPAGPPRQLLIADQRTATPDTPVIDLSVPLQ